MKCITQSSRIKLFSIVGLGIVTVAISADKVLSAENGFTVDCIWSGAIL